jgi:phosphoribosylamine--glycine ligase
MLTEDGAYVLEYNARFGDPEAEVVLPRIGGDFSALLQALAEGRLAAHLAAHPLEVSGDHAVDVVVAARGYPGTPAVGDRIEGVFDVPSGTLLFHAGTKRVNDAFVTSGGRVVHAVCRGSTLGEARDAAYRAVERVRFPGAFHRSDIAAGVAVPAR